MKLKQRLKAGLKKSPRLWGSYWRFKQELLRLWMLRNFVYDIGNTYRAMFWVPGSHERTTLAAALLFYFHKLEKGMSMPGPRRLFGQEPASEVMALLRKWRGAALSETDPVYLGALETLHGFVAHLDRHGLDPKGGISATVRHFLTGFGQRAPHLVTPVGLPPVNLHGNTAHGVFSQLAMARRSVRDFDEQPVPAEALLEAVRLAQLSPSACNRQPCRVYAVRDVETKKQILSYQNGNRGFGDRIPVVLVITADESCFFDASERHQPYIDGGLFSMSLCFALTALGLASCCLNWCVPVSNDRAVHAILGIRASERIVMFIATGYASATCAVPRSPRRDETEVLLPLSPSPRSVEA